jgi:hypothetical protein
MGSLRQELYFFYLLDIRTMGSFDVIEIELSQSAELQFGFNRYYTSYYRNVLKFAVPFHFGRLMFMKGSYFDHCLNEHIGKVVAIATYY